MNTAVCSTSRNTVASIYGVICLQTKRILLQMRLSFHQGVKYSKVVPVIYFVSEFMLKYQDLLTKQRYTGTYSLNKKYLQTYRIKDYVYIETKSSSLDSGQGLGHEHEHEHIRDLCKVYENLGSLSRCSISLLIGHRMFTNRRNGRSSYAPNYY